MTMAFEHLNLKIKELQEEIDRKREELDDMLIERRERCTHSVTIHKPFRSGTFIDSEELRVCTICGAWEMGFYNQFMDKIPPGRGELYRDETIDTRSELGRHKVTSGQIKRKGE